MLGKSATAWLIGEIKRDVAILYISFLGCACSGLLVDDTGYEFSIGIRPKIYKVGRLLAIR